MESIGHIGHIWKSYGRGLKTWLIRVLRNMLLPIFQLHFPLGWLYSQANSLLLMTRRPTEALRFYHTMSAALSPAMGIFISKRSRKGCHLPGWGHMPFPPWTSFWGQEKWNVLAGQVWVSRSPTSPIFTMWTESGGSPVEPGLLFPQ